MSEQDKTLSLYEMQMRMGEQCKRIAELEAIVGPDGQYAAPWMELKAQRDDAEARIAGLEGENAALNVENQRLVGQLAPDQGGPILTAADRIAELEGALREINQRWPSPVARAALKEALGDE